MDIMGCDLHTRYQVVAWMEEETGEIRTRRLEHESEEVRTFYGGGGGGAGGVWGGCSHPPPYRGGATAN